MNTPFIVRDNWTHTATTHPEGDVDHRFDLNVSTDVRRADNPHQFLTKEADYADVANTAEEGIVKKLYGKVQEDARLIRSKLATFLESPLEDYPDLMEVVARLEHAGMSAPTPLTEPSWKGWQEADRSMMGQLQDAMHPARMGGMSRGTRRLLESRERGLLRHIPEGSVVDPDSDLAKDIAQLFDIRSGTRCAFVKIGDDIKVFIDPDKP